MRSFWQLTLCTLTAFLLGAAPSRAGEPNWPDQLAIGTASPGGTYYVYGEGLARVLTRALDLPVVRVATEGPAENIELLEKGEARLGFVTTGIVLQAWNATGSGLQAAGAFHARHVSHVRHGRSSCLFSRSPRSAPLMI